MRICSLLPSATEVITLFGLSDELVGISHECDYPPSVRSLPIMSAAILHPSDHDYIHEPMACRLGPLPIYQRP